MIEDMNRILDEPEDIEFDGADDDDVYEDDDDDDDDDEDDDDEDDDDEDDDNDEGDVEFDGEDDDEYDDDEYDDKYEVEYGEGEDDEYADMMDPDNRPEIDDAYATGDDQGAPEYGDDYTFDDMFNSTSGGQKIQDSNSQGIGSYLTMVKEYAPTNNSALIAIPVVIVLVFIIGFIVKRKRRNSTNDGDATRPASNINYDFVDPSCRRDYSDDAWDSYDDRHDIT